MAYQSGIIGAGGWQPGDECGRCITPLSVLLAFGGPPWCCPIAVAQDTNGPKRRSDHAFGAFVRVMAKNFHESFAGGEVKPPSDRATGLVFAAVALIVALLWCDSPTVLWSALGMAAMLAIVSLLRPSLQPRSMVRWWEANQEKWPGV